MAAAPPDDEPLQPYGQIVEHGPRLWTLEGEWYDTPFKRRMTILGLASGGLVIHSAIRLAEHDWPLLDALGKVEAIVAPNGFHSSEAHWYKRRYPAARLLVSKGCEKEVRGQCPVDGVLPEEWPAAYASEVECLEIDGTRCGLHESVFLHRASRTLVLCDAAFNMKSPPGRIMRILYRINKIDGRFGPSRLFRHAFICDVARARASFTKILSWEFERVVVGHGEVVEVGAREGLRRGLAEMGLA